MKLSVFEVRKILTLFVLAFEELWSYSAASMVVLRNASFGDVQV